MLKQFIKQKSGQVSIFIIIGVILIIVASFLFFSGRVSFLVSESDRTTGQISELVESCVYNNAETGAFLLSVQGGYIDVPPRFRNNFLRQIDLGGFSIPNWDSNVGDIPTLTSMEIELNRFVEEESSECIRLGLNSFESFYNLDYIIENLEVTSTINPQNIIVETYLPVTFNMENDDRVYSVSDYRVILENMNLGDMYDLAVTIFNQQSSSMFIEELVLDQIYSASDYSSNEFSMPSEGMIFSCTPQIWTIQQLQENLANLNNNNFRYLQFEGTFDRSGILDSSFNEELGNSDLRQYFESQYRIPLQNTKPTFTNYDVNIVMPTGQIRSGEGYFSKYPYREFSVKPGGSSGIVKPINFKLGDLKVPIPCIQIYHHLYTLDYDLLVQINDLSEDGQGSFFQFPLRVQVFDNNPKQRPFIPQTDDSFGGYDTEFYCDEEQAVYPADIYAVDIRTGDYIPDVNVSFSCVSSRCELGSTGKRPFEGFDLVGESLLQTDLPFCYGGSIKGEKEGYFTLESFPQEINSISSNEVLSIDIDMVPTRSFTVNQLTFSAIDRDTCQTRLVESEDDGLFMLILENTEFDFQSVSMWPSDETGGVYNEIELLDYDIPYNVTAFYIGPDDNLRGLLQYDDWRPYPINGNSVQVFIPSVDQGLEGEDYLEYMEYVDNVMAGQNCGGVGIPYGVSIR